MFTAAVVCFTATLSGWWLLSAVAQLLPRGDAIRRSRMAWLLPEWRFFAPEPAVYNFSLFARVQTPGGLITEPTRYPERTLQRVPIAWNPTGRLQKVDRDVMEHLVSTVREATRLTPERSSRVPASVQLATSYLLLLRRAAAFGSPGDLVQFGVLRESPDEAEADLIFLSRWHKC